MVARENGIVKMTKKYQKSRKSIQPTILVKNGRVLVEAGRVFPFSPQATPDMDWETPKEWANACKTWGIRS